MNLRELKTSNYDYFPSSMFVKYLLTNTTNYIKLYKLIKDQYDVLTDVNTNDLLDMIPSQLINEIIKEISKDIYNNALKYAKYYYVNNYGLENYLDNEENIVLFNKYLFVLILRRHDMFKSEMEEFVNVNEIDINSKIVVTK